MSMRRFTGFLTQPDEDIATSRAWNHEYTGDAKQVLQDIIEEMNTTRGTQPYLNFVPIVQSSGMGKSRMVDELAKSVFTIPFNLRPQLDTSGYPPADPKVTEFFKIQYGDTRTTLELRYLNFLFELFTAVNDTLTSVELPERHKGLAAKWRAYLATHDPKYPNRNWTNRDILYGRVINKLGKQARDDDMTRAGNRVASAAQSLLSTIDKQDCQGDTEDHQGELKLVLYFDEFHSLTDDRLGGQSPYQILCSAFNAVLNQSIFVIYLSTLAPPRWSLRSEEAAYTLQTPIIELPFDLWGKVNENALTIDEACQVDRMVLYGRPLFGSRYMNGGPVVRGDIIRFAVEKLTLNCFGAIPTGDALLATLSMRLLLEIDLGRYRFVEIEEKLVAGHMRVAYSVPESREYMLAGSPSEPILAEAAAQVMNMYPWLEELTRFMQAGMIKKGQRGELVARVLLTRAHDAAVVARARSAAKRAAPSSAFAESISLHELLHSSRVRYSTPIPVIDFLTELVGKHNMEKILKSRPDNIRSGPKFQEALKDAYIQFTHFVKAIDSCPVSDDAAWQSMARGMCFQCSDHQEDIDIVLPVILNKEKPLGKANMTAILIQIKNKLKSQSVHIDAENHGFFTPGETDGEMKRPYISLVMNFDRDPEPPPSPSEAAECTYSKVDAHSGEISGATTPSATQASQHHPRYAITITGCSSSVYSTIRAHETHRYESLLASRSESLYEEHPRHWQPDAIRMIREMKPEWSFGPQWKGGGLPCRVYTADKLDEGVVVAKYMGDEEDMDVSK